MFVLLRLLHWIFQKVRTLKLFQSNKGIQDFHDDREPHPIFNTSLVLRHIAEHLPVPDLVNNFSLVNKLWHYEARSCLRDQKSCTFAPGRIKYPEDMEAVLELCRSSLVPFNRISLNCEENLEKDQWGNINFGLIFNIVDTMNLKCLHVKFYKLEFGSDSPVSTSTEKLIAHILRSKWKTLEEISFETIEYSRRYSYRNEEIVPLFGRLPHLLLSQEGFRLPALHSLTFDCRQAGDQELIHNCVLPILRVAPALKNLNLEIPPSLLFRSPNQPVLPPEKLRLLTRLTLSLCRYESWDYLKFLINNKIAYKRLKLTISAGNACTPKLTELLPPFLHRSRKTLTALITDTATIQLVQNAGLLSLVMPNMRYLFLRTGARTIGTDNWEQIFEMFARLRHTFPNLRSITLDKGWHSCIYAWADVHDTFGEKIDSAKKSEGLGWQTVKRLVFRDCYNSETADFFSILLPHLEHLSLNGPQETCEYSRIIQSWPNLESLEAVENRPNRLEFEAMVCGISVSKVCDWRQVPADKLKQTVVAPSRNSIIAGLSNLRSLRVNVAHDTAFKKGLKCPIPHVSKYAAFSKKKTLRVCYQYVPSSVILGEEEALVY